MISKLALATLTTALLAFGAAAIAAPTKVKEVSVEMDLEAIQNANAGAHWTMISDDLENAIVSRLAGQLADDGAKVGVDIDEIELANSLQSAVGSADSRLVGKVTISSETDNTLFDAYDLSVSFAQAGPYFLPGTDLTLIVIDSREYYQAMIAAFADHVVAKLQ